MANFLNNIIKAKNSLSNNIWKLTFVFFDFKTGFYSNLNSKLNNQVIYDLEKQIKLKFIVDNLKDIKNDLHEHIKFDSKQIKSELQRIYCSQYDNKIILEITTLLINIIKTNFNQDSPELFQEYLNNIEKILKSHKYTYSLNMEKIIPINNQLQEESLSSLFPLLADYGQTEEFIKKAWKEYIDRDYDNCVINAGKATETVMKCICERNSYQIELDKATFSKLFEILNTNNFFSRDEYLTPTLINTLIEGLKMGLPKHRNDSAHGSSLEAKNSNKYVAKLTLDLMVSYIHYFISLDKQL